MNVLTIFDQRVGNIFAEGAPGVHQPFSFKRLAKRAVREMEDETFVIDGIDTAPALFTILVSYADDATMRPLYIPITEEVSQLIEAQAKKRGYTFVGQPLVRFMIDPALRAGKFSVFAENIDPRTLARLRDEENAYLGLSNAKNDLYGVSPFEPASGPVGFGVSDNSDPLVSYEGDSIESEGPLMDAPLWPEDPAARNAVQPELPATGQPSVGSGVGTCVLVNMQTGQTFNVTNPKAPIGRVNTEGGIVLRDPNVSRVHAELEFDGSAWLIRDLNSTNGTLVNGEDVTESVLHNGDVLTIGLTDLEFQAG
ncbi:MAG: DUF3662 and FHA domain-containing protein [Atopobiaceae bacterium]|nr:DUF3662 and FHA domain-containing protein [Atopobiaceae bacterium]